MMINAAKLDRRSADRVCRWLHANGNRWWIPLDARIIVRGNIIEYESYTVREGDQVRRIHWNARRYLVDDDILRTRRRRIRQRTRLSEVAA